MQSDFSMGVSIFKRDDETLPEYFMSFSPMAPFFGVGWRFAPVLGLGAQTRDKDPVASAKPRPKRRSPAARMIEAVADPALSVAPAPATEAGVAVVEAAADVAEAASAPLVAAMPDEAVGAKGAATVAPAAAPAPAPGGKPAMLYADRPDTVDDLKSIKGVGPKLEAELNGLGLYTFAQMATLTPDNLAWIDDNLTTFKGRSIRDDWVGQAAALLEG